MAYHVPFDTLKFVETLTVGRMSIPQAKALLEALDNNLSQLAAKSKLEPEILALKTEIAKLNVEMFYMQQISATFIISVGFLVVKAFL